LAIIANHGRAIIVIIRQVVEINYFSFSLLILLKKPSTIASSNPFRVGSRGWCMLVHQNHAAGGENGSIMVGMFVSLCLASQNPCEREFFVPAGTDLGVMLLNIIP